MKFTECWLAKGGICILSTRFIYRYHPDPYDYFRFTRDSLNILFDEFDTVEIYEHGNKIQALWLIYTGMHPLWKRK